MRSLPLSSLVDALGANVQLRAGSRAEPAQVRAVVRDTDDVVPGALFCCVPGQRVDGHDLAPLAVERGAVALVVERPLGPADAGGAEVAQLLVPSVRAAMGPLAATFWGDPSHRLEVVGVTGTAGKTTVTQLLRGVLEASGRRCGTIGTLSGARTTPEAAELQAELAGFVERGVDSVTMEVSSHGLDLHRVDATWFRVAVFTNLSRDHLDFHPDMESYFAAKARLFTPGFTGHAVICTDDKWGRRLLAEMEDRAEELAGDAGVDGGAVSVEPYSLRDAEGLEMDGAGARFTWRGSAVALRVTGRFNVANAVAVATVAERLGVAREAIVRGLAEAGPAPGRFEHVDVGQPFTVLVDYAHKPDALEQALLAARDLVRRPEGRLTTVFGCGGDRDAGKRPLMGEVAARLADRVVVTSDNPRSEDPQGIISEVIAGMDRTEDVEVEPDRYRALEAALGSAAVGDVVVIAGKGHEATQTVGDRVMPFDDRQVAHGLLAAREGTAL